MWHGTCDTTGVMWQMTCNTWREVNILSKSQVPSFYRALKIWRKRLSQLINHKGVYRIAPATSGLLNITNHESPYSKSKMFVNMAKGNFLNI